MSFGSLPLLKSLNPAAVAAGADIPDAVTIDGHTLSRSDLIGAATSVAERVAHADRVAVLARPSATTVLAILGSLIAGVTVVPVPPDSGPAEIAHILADSGARAWLGEAPEDTELPAIPVRMHARSWHTYPEPGPDTTAFILYTSGTTGAPKGVVLSRGAIAAGLDALAQAWAWTANDVLVHGLPLFHVHGLILGVLGPLRVGSPLVHTGRPTPAAYAAAKGTIYFGVPTVWSRVVEDPSAARELANARLLVSGSAPLPVPVFERLRELTGQAPVERYGMSETMITLSTRVDGERRPGWVGTPVEGVRTRLRDESGEPVPHDGESIGGLQVRGPMLFGGYLKPARGHRRMLDRGRLVPHRRRRGHRCRGLPSHCRPGIGGSDQIRRLPDRRGRDRDRPARSRRGRRGGRGRRRGRRPGPAHRRLRGPARGRPGELERALIDHVAQQLSAHKRPREVRLVESLPRNAMGKVQKKLLG